MQMWEYFYFIFGADGVVFKTNGKESIARAHWSVMLEEAGKQGWELVSTVSGGSDTTLILKRSIESNLGLR